MGDILVLSTYPSQFINACEIYNSHKSIIQTI